MIVVSFMTWLFTGYHNQWFPGLERLKTIRLRFSASCQQDLFLLKNSYPLVSWRSWERGKVIFTCHFMTILQVQILISHGIGTLSLISLKSERRIPWFPTMTGFCLDIQELAMRSKNDKLLKSNCNFLFRSILDCSKNWWNFKIIKQQ